MSKFRRAARIDKNQNQIVDELRSIAGLSVQVGHDDILVGYKGKTYWYEIKAGAKSEIKESQKKILAEYSGHYKIVYTVDQILEDIKLNKPEEL